MQRRGFRWYFAEQPKFVHDIFFQRNYVLKKIFI